MDPLTRLLMQGAAGAGGEVLGVEDVFSTWLYTGNNGTQTITNGIDLAGEGGLVWIKPRSFTERHTLWDTTRGSTKYLSSNLTTAENTLATGLTTFNSSGFVVGPDSYVNFDAGAGGGTYASWTFRKAPGFFDVVTYTGNGSTQNIAHSLGSVPGFVVIKRTDSTSNWICWHRSINATNNDYLVLNTTSPVDTTNQFSPWPWNSTTPTSTQFSVGYNGGMNQAFGVNVSGGTYVAYLFAHDAGGFGDSGNESVIKCGFSNNGTFNDLGWEPQWILVKSSASLDNWFIYDNMRGIPVSGTTPYLNPNTSGAEANGTNNIVITPTGFTQNVTNGIWIAIRRGPMKTPTDATKVFATGAYASDASTLTTGFPVDVGLDLARVNGYDKIALTRLLGSFYLSTNSTAAAADSGRTWWTSNTSFTPNMFGVSISSAYECFRRAPGFFDVVAYTGTGSARTVSHNLGVVPELMIVKRRNTATSWSVYSAAIGASNYLVLNLTDASTSFSGAWDSTSPTSSVFTVGTSIGTNASASTYIAYLFATCPGVSKVGSYTGTGTTLQIDCGFTAGARFVLIKRADSTGDWYVWDTARGISSGNDPYLLLNSTAAEVTSTDYIDPLNSGFEISSTAPAAINANGGTFIFLAVA